MFNILYVLVALDVALLGGWLLWVRPTPDVAIIGAVIIPLLAVFNALVAAVCWLRKRPALAGAFLLNVFFASGVFALLLDSWYDYDRQGRYLRYAFAQDAKHYELILEKKKHGFSISDVTNQKDGYTTEVATGEYVVRHDSVVLREWNGTRRYVLHQRMLRGFEGRAVPILLRELK
ncbi:hypothetical protein [Hymenobacter arizonensis]|uniref:Transmembrane protein n=1 Tax=Hymenobacter arizonensis TaxID=1227077 RepID=A0A1I6BK58_HYMAR|nr:hypothetical protein [Hymenobacter arizonensis]SFQ81322.1 hypothetical protein SAMN04515668_4649 [Hymenobacter arizonensis]